MCAQARDAALFTLKLAIALSVSRIILLLGPGGYDTYYNLQVARAMPEVISAVLIAGGIGSVWLQMLDRRNK
jgi:hypothetical protein